MKTLTFRNAIKKLGYDIVKYNKGYNYRSAFATEQGSGKLYYFNIGDLRDRKPIIYRRTAESTSDYIGGTNLFDINDKLAEMGYTIVEKRQDCDYNKG